MDSGTSAALWFGGGLAAFVALIYLVEPEWRGTRGARDRAIRRQVRDLGLTVHDTPAPFGPTLQPLLAPEVAAGEVGVFASGAFDGRTIRLWLVWPAAASRSVPAKLFSRPRPLLVLTTDLRRAVPWRVVMQSSTEHPSLNQLVKNQPNTGEQGTARLRGLFQRHARHAEHDIAVADGLVIVAGLAYAAFSAPRAWGIGGSVEEECQYLTEIAGAAEAA